MHKSAHWSQSEPENVHMQEDYWCAQAMAWLGRHIVVVTSLRYMLFDPTTSVYTELFAVSPEAPPPTMVQAVPSVNQAVLLMVSSSSHLPQTNNQ